MTPTGNETAWMISIATMMHSSWMTWTVVKLKTADDIQTFQRKFIRFLSIALFSLCILFAIFILYSVHQVDAVLIAREEVFSIVSAAVIVVFSMLMITTYSVYRLACIQKDHLGTTQEILARLKLLEEASEQVNEPKSCS